MLGFHSHLNVFWERQQDGSVVVKQVRPDGAITWRHVLTAEEWASVVASVALRDCTSSTREEALRFHMRPQP